MMQVDPKKRCGPEEALAHPYLELYHDVDNEPSATTAIRFDADAIEQLEPDTLKDALLAEAAHFEAEQLTRYYTGPAEGFGIMEIEQNEKL